MGQWNPLLLSTLGVDDCRHHFDFQMLKLASEDVTYYASRDHELCMIQNGAKNKQCFARRIGYGAIDVVNADRNTSEFKKGWSQIMISEDLKKMASKRMVLRVTSFFRPGMFDVRCFRVQLLRV